jgi:uncharacterized protein YjbI with pentapeptide repeats
VFGLRQRFFLSWSLGLLGAVLLGIVFIPSWLVAWILGRMSWSDTVLVVLAIGLLTAAFLWRPMVRYSSAFPPGARMLRIVSAWWVVAALAAVLIALWGSTAWLLSEADRILDPSERGLARIEAVRSGMQTAAGVGAGAALLLSFRRQRHQEAAAKGVEHDANERRVTELYLNAANQLGAEKAPVRLAGLYALERLGKANPEHRQTIVDVICAYLRMPPAGAEGPVFEEERQVRKTAQRILAAHLRWDREGDFWPQMRLDLDGATLTDPDFRAIRVDFADFSNAHFLAGADFNRARFEGEVSFAGCDFKRKSSFSGAEFRGEVSFKDATFAEEPGFQDVKALDSSTPRIWPPGVVMTAVTAPSPRPPAENWLVSG